MRMLNKNTEDILQSQSTMTGGYHSFCSSARRCKGYGTARDPQDNLHPALAAPPKADCVELQCPYTPADSCQSTNKLTILYLVKILYDFR